jgi:hypothetical protein
MSLTLALAADMTGSLSFFLSASLVEAFSHVLSNTEIVILSLVMVALSTIASEQLGLRGDLLRRAPLLGNVKELLDTTTLLGTNIAINIAVGLIRESIAGPGARVISIFASLLLLRCVRTASSMGRRRVK